MHSHVHTTSPLDTMSGDESGGVLSHSCTECMTSMQYTNQWFHDINKRIALHKALAEVGKVTCWVGQGTWWVCGKTSSLRAFTLRGCGLGLPTPTVAHTLFISECELGRHARGLVRSKLKLD